MAVAHSYHHDVSPTSQRDPALRNASNSPSPTASRRVASNMESSSASSYHRASTGPTRRKSSNLLSTLGRSNTYSSTHTDRAPLLESSLESSDGFPVPPSAGQSSSSLELSGQSNGGSVPNLPSQSLSIALENQRQIATKRLNTWLYMKSVHQGGKLAWLGSVCLTRQELASNVGGGGKADALQKRTIRFMVLGCSLGPLLEISSAHDFLRALLTLVTEFDNLTDENLLKPRMVRSTCLVSSPCTDRDATTESDIQARLKVESS